MPSATLPKRTRAQAKKDEAEENDATQIEEGNKDEDQIETKGDKKDAVDCSDQWENSMHTEDGQNEYKKFKEAEAKAAEADSDAENDEEHTTTKKRGGGANAKTGTNKKQKSASGENKGEPQGTAGDKTRVPAKGQHVQWSAQPGTVDGEVVEVLYEEKTVEGKVVKGSKEDPHLVLKSSASGKICVHKPEAVYFD